MTDKPRRRRILRLPVGAVVFINGIRERIRAVRRGSVEVEIEAAEDIDIRVEQPEEVGEDDAGNE